jgi:hypothetical protein
MEEKIYNQTPWSDEEINKLKELYSETSNVSLMSIFNRPIKSIESKAYRLNLKKSKEYKSKWIAKRNKKMGRDLNKEFLTNLAKKFKTKS